MHLGEPSTIFHPAPVPYCIPYGSLVSHNLDNFMLFECEASCTHEVMSSTHVMGLCSLRALVSLPYEVGHICHLDGGLTEVGYICSGGWVLLGVCFVFGRKAYIPSSNSSDMGR